MTWSAENRRLAYFHRKQKKSYSEIRKITGIPKSTLSGWLFDKDWSIEIKNKLAAKQIKKYKFNIIRASKTNARNRKIRDKRFILEARQKYLKLRNDPLFIFGLGLYWGEGDKKTRSRVAIANTDPNMLRVEVQFFRECLGVDDNKLRVALFLYEDINLNKAIEFWSKRLKIPQSQFIKTQILKSRARLTKTKSKYGICNLYFSNTELSIKILEWIRLLSLDIAGLA